MRKWTIRIQKDTAETFRQLCEASGVTIQAMIESTVIQQAEWFEEHGGHRPDEWGGPPEVLSRWMEVIARARRIDAAKRTRSQDGE